MLTTLPATEASPARRALAPWLCGLCLVVVAASGCRTARDNQIDLLERELRTQEDYIYELEDYVMQYSEKLRECRCCEPTVITSEPTTKSVVRKSKPTPAPVRQDEQLEIYEETFESEDSLPAPSGPTRRANPPAIAPPPVTPEDTSPENLEAPELEIGAPVGRAERDSNLQRAEYLEATQLPPVEDELVEPVAYEYMGPVAENIVVAHLLRSEPGDESPATLLAVVELHDADDEPIEVDGEVSLMVMTADSEQPKRLKRWDFTADDAASAWQSSHLGDGLHLELPLEETELPAAPLELWIRVVNPDGSKLLSQVPFEREQLVALDDGGESSEAQLALQEADADDHSPQGKLLSAEEPVTEPADAQSGWKPSLVRSDAVAPASSKSTAKSSGWTSQPPGGRFPELQRATAEREPGARQPIWTAGRIEPVSNAPTRRGTNPQWSPFR